MGTPTFAVPVLSALMGAGQEPVGVYTQPDKPAGRGRKPAAPPVKQFAQERGLRVLQPTSLRPKEVEAEMSSLGPEVLVVAAYGRIIPSNILSVPPLGSLNVHPSILPRYRGPSPVSSAILSGETVTGVTIMVIGAGVDSGPVLGHRETPVGPTETAEELTTRLFEMGASLLVEVLPVWAEGRIQARPQDESQATLTRRLTKEDGEIAWSLSAVNIARQVRAYYPWPGSYTRWKGTLVKIVAAHALERTEGTPLPQGAAVSLAGSGLGVATGEGVLAVSRLQLQGRRAVGAREFLQGYPDFVGATLGRK